jgi:hypothetical protein
MKFARMARLSPDNGKRRMRFIVERWYVVPIGAFVALYICAMVGYTNGRAQVRKVVEAKIDRIYELAKAGDYERIHKEHLAPSSVSDYLRQQDALFGKAQIWRIEVNDEFLSDSFLGTVTVGRLGVSNTDKISGQIHGMSFLSLDAERYSGDGVERNAISSPDEAIAAARVTMHSLDPAVIGATARAVGKQWLLTERIADQTEPNYLVIASDGTPLQYVRQGEIMRPGHPYGYPDWP